MNRELKILSVCTTVIMYIVLLQGALVTNSGSSDGCGSNWPLCHGTFMPEWDYAAIIEFSHRVVSALAGLMVIVLAVWAWRVISNQPMVKYLGLFAVITIIVQGLLGAASVVWKQPAWALALHFGIALICFASVLLLQVLIFRSDRGTLSPLKPVDSRIQRLIWGTVLFSYVVIYLGAYVRHVKASLACSGWPLCNGQIIPTLAGQIGASFLHRVAAALLGFAVVWVMISLRRSAAYRVDLIRAGYLALFLVLLQAASGALMAVGYYNLLTQMLHSAIVTAFWGCLCYLSMQVLPDLIRSDPYALDGRTQSKEA